MSTDAAWWIAAALAVWMHRPRADASPRAVRRLLAAFGLALLVWRMLDLLAQQGFLDPGAPAATIAKGVLALIVWAATMGLVAHGSRRAELWLRGALLAGAFACALNGS